MAISEEEAKRIKEHLLKQLSNFPKDKREMIEEKVNEMTKDQVEEFVQKNQLKHLGGQCIFCAIVSGYSPSFKIEEDNENMAILEINPISRGHTLVVPKDHSEKIKSSTKVLAEKIAKLLKERLNPKEVKINELMIMEHALMEVIPLYGTERQRKQATEEELKEIQEELTGEKKVEEELEEEGEEENLPTAIRELYKMPPRIP